MIHVCYAIYDGNGKYSKFAGTSILSMFENTHEQITVHLFHDNTLTASNRDKFTYLAAKYCQQIIFYNADTLISDQIEKLKKDIPNLQNSFSVASMYRLFVPQILSDINKIIYLDSGDTIVNCDIKNLWDINIKDKPLAAVTEMSLGIPPHFMSLVTSNIVKYEDYFNSGVLLLNLDYMRKHLEDLWEGYKFVRSRTECSYFDQDMLNVSFSKKYLKLPTIFNNSVRSDRVINRINKLGRKIYHFNGGDIDKVNLNTDDVYNRMYFDYFIKSPWFDADVFGKIFDEVRSNYHKCQFEMLKMSRLMSGKIRAFFTEQQNVESVKNMFGVMPNETIIVPPPPPSNYRYAN